jgi:hypothetical protein
MRTVEAINEDISYCGTLLEKEEFSSGLCRDVIEEQLLEYQYELVAAIGQGIEPERLKAICTAEREGRCYTPPCKVGDTVYWYNGVCILEQVCRGFHIDTAGNLRFVFKDFQPIVSWGNWSLTREAAEAKLRGGDNNEK